MSVTGRWPSPARVRLTRVVDRMSVAGAGRGGDGWA